MYVIKMRTVICYFAVFVFFASAFGLLRFFGAEGAESAEAAVSDTAPVDNADTTTSEKSAALAEGSSYSEENSAKISSENTAVSDSAAENSVRLDDDVARFGSEGYVKLPVLMYHSICKSGGKTGKYIISETDFENDLKYLNDNGYTTVVFKDLIDYIDKKAELPSKPVMLTFDDGYFNNYVYAYPLLKEYNSRAVLSIIGYYTDLYTKTPDENPAYSHVTWDNVKEMIESGTFEFQNHSYNLHSTDNGRNGSKKKRGESAEEYREMLCGDLGKLQEEFETNTGVKPIAYTYPFGSVSNASFPIIKELGFRASLSCESGMNRITRNPECLYMLKRYLRTPSKSAADMLK